MMPPWVQSEELNIHQVRQPREGMPELGIQGREGPPNGLPSEAVLNMLVFTYVLRIIIIDEIALRDLPESQEGGDDEERDDEPPAFDHLQM